VNLAPRKLLWIENTDARCIATGAGILTTYKGEFVMVVAGKSLEECQRLFCDMLRTRGTFGDGDDK
jgi:hypothetical protein